MGSNKAMLDYIAGTDMANLWNDDQVSMGLHKTTGVELRPPVIRLANEKR